MERIYITLNCAQNTARRQFLSVTYQMLSPTCSKFRLTNIDTDVETFPFENCGRINADFNMFIFFCFKSDKQQKGML